VLLAAAGCNDISDHLDAGYGLGELRDLRATEATELAAALDAAAAVLCRYVVWPSESAPVAVTLWLAHTHIVSEFESTPRLAFLSPEVWSGKSRSLVVLERLTPAPMMTANISTAALARTLDAGSTRTVLLDECDAVFGSRAREHEDLRAILNAGHRRGATYARCVGEGAKMTVRSFNRAVDRPSAVHSGPRHRLRAPQRPERGPAGVSTWPGGLPGSLGVHIGPAYPSGRGSGWAAKQAVPVDRGPVRPGVIRLPTTTRQVSPPRPASSDDAEGGLTCPK
jgi:hypothetical protein